jgi:hypothetical protein
VLVASFCSCRRDVGAIWKTRKDMVLTLRWWVAQAWWPTRC